MNDVLRGQNDALNREREKLKTELDELNAFLDDIEAETELKSMCEWTIWGGGGPESWPSGRDRHYRVAELRNFSLVLVLRERIHLVANIERRFLQALREQSECAEEREALGCELRRSERNFR